MSKLINPQEEEFCRNLLDEFDPRKAAVMAGYEAACAGETAQSLMSRMDVQSRLRELEKLKTLVPAGMPENMRRFCERYVETYNLEAAADFAGVAPDRAREFGMMVLSDPLGRSYVRSLKEEHQRLKNVSRLSIISELASLAFSNVKDVCEWDDSTLEMKPSSDISREAAACISEIKQTKDGITVKFHSKLKALEVLSKVVEMFGDAFADNATRQQELLNADQARSVNEALSRLSPDALATLQKLSKSSGTTVQ